MPTLTISTGNTPSLQLTANNASYALTASYAQYVMTASYASNVMSASHADHADTASFSVTASYALNGGGGGGGGSSITVTNTAFLDLSGDDGTAVIGDPSKPFLTSQAIFDAVFPLATENTGTNYLIFVNAGTFGYISAPSGWPSNLMIAGLGPYVSILAGINSVPPAQTGIYDNGLTGAEVIIHSNQSVNLGNISMTGGTGGPGDGEGDAGNGGNAGAVFLTNCYVATVSTSGASGQNNGSGGNVFLKFCTCTSGLNGDGSTGCSFQGSESYIAYIYGISYVIMARCAYESLSATTFIDCGIDGSQDGSAISSNVIDTLT